MHTGRHYVPAAVLVAMVGAALLATGSCKNDDSEPAPVTPAAIQGLMTSKLDNIPGLGAALQRTVTHLSGTPQPGVNITQTATGGSGTVGVDQDGDGFQESTVTGTLTWNDPALGFAGGAVLEISELTGNTVMFSALLLASGPTQVGFTNIAAIVPAEGDRPQVQVSGGAINVDVSTSPPQLGGYADFSVGDLPATMFLSSDGSGNPSINVQGASFAFTVP